jgi:hypothetical protein
VLGPFSIWVFYFIFNCWLFLHVLLIQVLISMSGKFVLLMCASSFRTPHRMFNGANDFNFGKVLVYLMFYLIDCALKNS